MTTINVDEGFWQLFPDAKIGVLTVHGIDNHVKIEQTNHFQELLDASAEKSRQFLVEDVFRDNAVISQWRTAFTQFKKKKGARSSIEALLKRIDQGNALQSINPLVDIYNSVSLSFAMPCGGEDLNKIDGTMRLGIAEGGESFRPLGEDEDQPALNGEVIYYDQTGAICRCLNWRDAQRTMLTEATTDAILVMEAINDEQQQRLAPAMDQLKEYIGQMLGVTGDVVYLDQYTPKD